MLRVAGLTCPVDKAICMQSHFVALHADVRHACMQSWIAMEDVDGDAAVAGELRQRQQHDNTQVVQPSNIAATFDLEAAEAPLQALFTNVSPSCPLLFKSHLHQFLSLLIKLAQAEQCPPSQGLMAWAVQNRCPICLHDQHMLSARPFHCLCPPFTNGCLPDCSLNNTVVCRYEIG